MEGGASDILCLASVWVMPVLGERLGLDLDVFYWIVIEPVEWLWPIFDRLAGGVL